ncbi:hypothetical protein Y1Q_0003173 [Alligator mississippiensis]|uniref:Uncharacterized protein n=1 Tax=Alligator mississippiensis TaxID=8496 RepID=A0A151MDR4_ALLMI|nr:hypothetical protein Y1Q_0003173 [Alligator mississippiensis]
MSFDWWLGEAPGSYCSGSGKLQSSNMQAALEEEGFGGGNRIGREFLGHQIQSLAFEETMTYMIDLG